MDEKHRIEIEDKRSRGNVADDTGAAGLVDMAELQEHVDVPASDPEVDAVAGRSAGWGSSDSDDLAHWRAKAAEYLDLAQRKEAELRNYVRRVQQDMVDARRFAVENLLADLFPVLDALAQAERSYAEANSAEPQFAAVLSGLRSTARALEAALLKHGIQKINTAPATYDPEIHQALQVEHSADANEDTVVEVYLDGYRLGNTVLKPALVKVVKPLT